MILLDGKKVSTEILDNLKSQIEQYIAIGSRTPRIDILLVGDDFASHKYVEMKSKKAKELGIKAVVHMFDSKVEEKELIGLIEELNTDNRVDGVMVQLPLPDGLDQNGILENISPFKDVDGLTSSSLGKLFKNDPTAIAPATAKGVLEILKYYNINLEGSNAVVIGRSDIVGLPTAAILQNSNATVTVGHSKTKNLKEICKQADILVVGIGRAEFVDKRYVKEGCVVVDIGTNMKDGKLVGDVNFKSVSSVSSYITPVPGGVGPMTIASLLLNLFEVYKKNVKRY